jgi:glycogen debranching enzyme
MLAAVYYDRTCDRAFIDSIWPNIVAAIEWMEKYGDSDGDGFLEYARRSRDGLVQQGWKDSHDSVFHADGSPAEPPIALCEVQGYAYAAFEGAARLAQVRGDSSSAERWSNRATALRGRFEEAFWCEELGTYALALDGKKAPCRVRTSNAAHTLFTGLPSVDRARRVAAALMADSTFAGWGVRTVDSTERSYNPMSYHNGSVWPHDNAIAAAGLARYGLGDGVERIFEAMYELSQVVDLHRLPELICGFHRRGGELPTLYPVACAPQTWSAGGVYLLLQSCLGLRIDAVTRRITFHSPHVPSRLKWIRFSRLRVGDASVDLHIERRGDDAAVEVRERRGDVEVIVET